MLSRMTTAPFEEADRSSMRVLDQEGVATITVAEEAPVPVPVEAIALYLEDVADREVAGIEVTLECDDTDRLVVFYDHATYSPAAFLASTPH